MHCRPVRLIVVEGIPIAHELLEQRHIIGILGLFDMQDQSARREHTAAFGQQPWQRLARQFVQEHGCLHPVESSIGPSREIFAIGLDKPDVPDPQPRRTGCAIAQRCPGGIDRNHFGIGKSLGQRHCAVADRAADIEDSPRLPVGPLFPKPGNHRLPGAIVETAQRTASSREDADIVVCSRRDVARSFLTVVTARLAMDINCGLVPRLLHRSIEFELARMLSELARLGVEFVELAEHGLASVLLAHLH